MSFDTYSDLKSAVPNWYRGRSDLAASMDDIIDLAESHLNQNLRCREMETTVSLTPSSNVCTLPDDYVAYKRVVEKASVRRPLKYTTEDAADYLYPTRDSGLSNHFMIIGNSLMALPLSTNDIELVYYQKIPALSDATATNWLLARSPNLYLHTCLFYAAEFVENDTKAVKEAALMAKYMGELTEFETLSKFYNAGVTLQGNVA